MLSLLGLIIIINVDIIFRFVIGFGTMAVAKSKGYSGNWFWMGLFFGLLGLLIVWALHPANPYVERTREVTKTDIAGRGSWRCSCGLLNAYYVGTCTCGRGKPSNNFVGMRTISYSEQNYRKDQWKCPNCQTENGIRTKNCRCGFTFEEYEKRLNMLEEERIRIAERKREREKEELIRQREEEKKFADYINQMGITKEEGVILRMIKNSSEGISLNEILRKLPRSADVNVYKDSIKHLEENEYFIKDEEGIYSAVVKI